MFQTDRTVSGLGFGVWRYAAALPASLHLGRHLNQPLTPKERQTPNTKRQTVIRL